MGWPNRVLGVVVPVLGLVVCGCVGDGAPLSRPADNNKVTTRSQRPDTETPPEAARPVQVAMALPQPPAAEPPGTSRLRIRAWVNAKPIFDEEVVQAIMNGANLELMKKANPAEVATVQARLFNQELEKLIERELIYQDAVRKLEKNPRMLDKLKAAANKEFDKMAARMMKASGANTMDELKLLMQKYGISIDSMRRNEERNFLATEYMRSLIQTIIQKDVGHQQIREYYDQHPNEFQTVDTVKWQDVFIAVGAKHATLADARAFAEGLVARHKKGEDFAKFLAFDDGDSWQFRKGDGFGRQRGEIKPVELEPHLFKMREGEVGPLVEMPTGIHIFRLEKREVAGQRPFDEKVQTQISVKLRNDIANREYRRIVQDLRSRSVVEIESRGGP